MYKHQFFLPDYNITYDKDVTTTTVNPSEFLNLQKT